MEEGIHKRKRVVKRSTKDLDTDSSLDNKSLERESFIAENVNQEDTNNKHNEIEDENILDTTNNLEEDKYNSLHSVNLDLERGIAKIKKKKKTSNFKKKLNILFSSYLLTYKSLSIEKIIAFWGSILLGVIFLFLTFNALSNKFLISVPTYGGTWSEGIIGVPRYINPVLASSDGDKDMVKLVFSGLLRKNADGSMVNDMASEVIESEDGLTYTVKINEKAKFQDGEKLTADDVVFTLSKIQDKNINSPIAINFEGVTIEKIDEYTVVFHLKKPFLYFNEALSFGILPKHILGDLSTEEFTLSEFNTNPIGSGPFKIDNIEKTSNVAKKYSLSSNRKYVKGRPFLNNLNIFIYQNNDDLLTAINNSTIDGTNYLTQNYINKINKDNNTILMTQLPNVFSLSFNPNKNKLLASKENRSYLAKAIDKDEIIKNVFGGYATKKDFFFGDSVSRNNIELKDPSKLAETEINISTADIDELKQVAENIANKWREKGLKVNVLVYSLSEMGEVIKNRNYEVLLFGSIIEHDTDLFAYWHSTQRAYPGLNITDYASKNLDKNLEVLKKSIDIEERESTLEDINNELITEMPAVPIYSNNSNYIIRDKAMAKIINNLLPKEMIDKSDRFTEINNWYEEEEEVWRFSYKRNLIETLENIIH